MLARNDVAISIVSHRHAAFVSTLLADFEKLSFVDQIIITVNVEDEPIIVPDSLKERCVFLYNDSPKGFGANHNAASKLTTAKYFAVVNPDIRLVEDIIPSLVEEISRNSLSFAAPVIISSAGHLEDSMRYFPTPFGMICRILKIDLGTISIKNLKRFAEPDWVAGMFLLFDRRDFYEVGGFDEDFYLYCEDVDICYRLRMARKRFRVLLDAKVIHDAQRSSHKKLGFLFWHVRSLILLFFKHPRLLFGQRTQRSV